MDYGFNKPDKNIFHTFYLPVVPLTPEQIDEIMMNLQAGLDLAFQRAKAWSKYLKDVMSYIERRAQLGM